MSDTLHVFISATSGDLGTVRELVKQGLLTMRCLPIEQTNFPPDYREVADMLEERIRGCEAVVHLVGLRYGAEPDPASLPRGAPRRSFTQMEEDIARRLGKKVYVFLCPAEFPFDPCESEPEELAALQRAYREEITARTRLHTKVGDREEVAERIRELQLDVEKMREALARHRRRTFALAAGFVLLLAGLAALIWWNVRPAVLEKTADAAARKALTAREAGFDRERIKANLVGKLKADAAERIAKLDRALDWEKIAALEKERDRQLADVDRFLEGMEQAFEKNEVSANYATASRLLAERGPAEALRFLQAKGGERDKKLEVLQFAKDRAEEAIRKLLREKLLAASLLEKDSHWDQAETEYRVVVRAGDGWPEPRNALAALLRQRGEVIDPSLGNAKLREAADLCRSTATANTRDSAPQAWAASQTILAGILWTQAARTTGADCRRLLADAIAAYRATLQVYSRERSPDEWAVAQANLGNVLRDQANQVEGTEGRQLLQQAIAAYRAALEVRTRERWPQDWAETQDGLGTTLTNLALISEGEERQRLLSDALAGFHAALEIDTLDASPQRWASLQCNLGGTLAYLGQIASNIEGRPLLSDALLAFRESLKVYSREQSPQRWASVQNNIGGTLSIQGERMEGEGSRAIFDEAILAYRAALEVTTREQLPQQWAMTQHNLGNALLGQGKLVDGVDSVRLLENAVAAYRLALEVLTRSESPQDWAKTHSKLGDALEEQAMRASGAASQRLLGEAVVSYRAVLEVFSREEMPQIWAETQNKLGYALAKQGERLVGEEGRRHLQEAVAACRASLEVWTREQFPEGWASTQDSLAYALTAQGSREPGQAGDLLLRDAIAAYRGALEVLGKHPEIKKHLSLALMKMSRRVNGAEAETMRAEAAQIAKELATP